MQTEQGKTDRPDRVAIVRLLNGILKGCEYPLSVGKTLFISADCDQLESEGAFPSFPADCVLIPADGGGVNFELICAATPDHGVLLRRLDDSGAEDVPLVSNQPIILGALALVVRSADEKWTHEVLNYQQVTPAAPVKPKAAGRAKWVLIAVAAMVCAALMVSQLNSTDARAREIVALTQQLGDEPGKYRMFPGRDGVLYVLADNERDAAWGRQSLVRLKSSQSIKINSHQDEKQRIEHWLSHNYPKLNLHKLQFENPTEPLLMVSRQRGQLTEAQRVDIRRGLMQQLPYAEDIRFSEVDDDIVAAQAEEGIKKLAVNYTRIDNQDSVTFVINGTINDGERQRIRYFVEEYDRQWNGKYVQFAIELKDEWLKGKSFKYGHDGYVKMTPGHWYFPSIN